MKIRKRMQFLLNLGNYSNVTLDSEVAIDTESDAAQLKLTGKETFKEIDDKVNKLLIESVKEQHEALNELPDSTFSYKR